MHLSFKRLTQSKLIKGWAKGVIFYNGCKYEGVGVLELFVDCDDEDDIFEIVKGFSGFYSIVVYMNDVYYIVTDRVNSIPIYYSIDHIKDTFSLNEQNGFFESDSDLKSLYELSGVVTGTSTFAHSLKSSEAAELISIYKNDIRRRRYKYQSFNSYQQHCEVNKDNHFEKFSELVKGVTEKLKVICDKRTVIVPLSGGYDSRLVVTMLHKAGVKNVICYTYGQDTDVEVKISESLANFYNYQWYFVKYDKKFLRDSLSQHDFNDFKSNYLSGNSVLHFQDFFAVRELIARNIIDRTKNNLIIPGHALDFLAGNHIPSFCFESENVKLDELYRYIKERHFSLRFRSKYEDNLVDKFLIDFVSKNCKIIDSKYISSDAAIEIYMNFNFIERQSKIILNSLRVYDFFGLDWYMPLWDNEFFYFFENCEHQLLKSRFIHVNWDHLVIKPTLTKTIRQLAYDSTLAKPAKIKLFFIIRTVLTKIGLYRALLILFLFKKTFVSNVFGWFDMYGAKVKFKGVFLGYKEIYSYLSNRERGIY